MHKHRKRCMTVPLTRPFCVYVNHEDRAGPLLSGSLSPKLPPSSLLRNFLLGREFITETQKSRSADWKSLHWRRGWCSLRAEDGNGGAVPGRQRQHSNQALGIGQRV